jgi:hypothetical protein
MLVFSHIVKHIIEDKNFFVYFFMHYFLLAIKKMKNILIQIVHVSEFYINYLK